MKIRKGFVSNSSSSSFVCDICGDTEVGYDQGLSDFDMVECVNGHSFHIECGDTAMSFEKDEMIKIITEYYDAEIFRCKDRNFNWLDSTIEEYETFKSTCKDMSEYEMQDIIDDRLELRYNYPASKCPICNLNYITDTSAVKYMYKKYEVDPKEIKDEMKDKFKSIDELSNFIK